jgi:pimeloyl-ACP methyl ester carboxylesterase
MLALVLSGILITTQNGTEIGREAWRDDGKVVTSDITVMGQKATISIDRKKHNLHVDQSGQPIDIAIPPDGAALMNLNWAAYGVLASEFKDASTPTPFKAVLGKDRIIQANVTVHGTADGGREVTVAVGPLEVHATVDKAGAVTHAAVPMQGIEVKPGTSASAPPVRRKPPAGVVEEPFAIDNRGTKLAGDLWLPEKRTDKVPVVIVIAGSGPVDRDGNAGGVLRSDAYRMLAEALAKRGVATIRYDKRGVGESTFGGKLEDLGFDDFVSDAAALVTMARVNDKLGDVYLFGHSEGSLIALEVAATTKVDGIISAAGAGRPVGEVMREQLSRQLDADDLKELDGMLAALKAGKHPEPKAASLQRLFRPELAKFMRGLLMTDPRPLARSYKGKLTVVQGDNDVEVTVDKDAKALAAAHPGAKLVVLKDVSHILKHDAKKGQDQPSYRDPTMPLDPGVVDATMATIR